MWPEPSFFPAVFSEGSLIVGAGAGKVQKLRLTDGGVVWEQSLGMYVGELNILLDRDGFYLSGFDIKEKDWSLQIEYRKVADGTLVWRRAIDEQMLFAQSMCMASSGLHIATKDGNLYRLDRDGNLKALLSVGESLACVREGHGGFYVTNAARTKTWFLRPVDGEEELAVKAVDAVVLDPWRDGWIGVAGKDLVRIDLDFEMKVLRAAPDTLVSSGRVALPVYAVSGDRLMWPVPPGDEGQPPSDGVHWCSLSGPESGSFPVPAAVSFAIVGEYVLMSHIDNTLALVSALDGTVVWTHPLSVVPRGSPLVVSKDQVIVFTPDGIVTMLNIR